MGLGNTTRETILLEINAKSNKFRSSMDRMRQGLMKPIKNLKQFGQIMRAKKGDINSMSEKTKASLNPLGRFGVGLRKATHGMRGFRMEMLGVMFFGKMLQKTFTGLLRPIMEVFGIFDMFKTMLKVLFLPIMKVLFPFFLKLFKAVINMSPAMKKMIGWFVVAGVVIGTALFLVGSLALGIGSLILALGWLVTPLGLALAGFLALIGITGIATWIKNIGSEADKTGDKVVEMGMISASSFGLLKDGAVKAFSKIKEVFSGLKTKIGDWLAEHAPAMLENGGALIMNIGKGIVKNADKIGTALGSLIGNVITWIADNGPALIDFGLDILSKLLQGIKDNASNISEALQAITSSVSSWIINNASKIAALGFEFVQAMFKGIGGAMFDAIMNRERKIFVETHGQEPEAYFKEQGIKSSMFNPFPQGLAAAGITIGEPIIINNTFNGFTSEDLERSLDERDRNINEEINRKVNQ